MFKMKLFNKEKKEIRRLDEEELRDFYLDQKKYEKQSAGFSMVLSSLGSIGFFWLAGYLYFNELVYWAGGVLVVALLFAGGFLINLNRFKEVIEDMLLNKQNSKIKQGRVLEE